MKKIPSWKKARTFLGFAVIGWLLMTEPFDTRDYARQNMVQLSKPDRSILFDSSLNRDQYVRIKDSLDNVEKKNIYNLKASPSTGMSNNFVGVVKLNDCRDNDTLNDSPCIKYYVELLGFTLKTTANFYMRDQHFFVSSFLTTPDQSPKNKEVSVRMKIDESRYSPATSLLIPVKESTYRIYKILLEIITVIFVFFALVFCFILPLRTFYIIATGHAFTERNIKHLRLIGWSLIVISLIPCIVSLIASLILFNKIPIEIIFPYWLSIYEHRGWLIAGLVCLLLADAFKTGYELKKEQDLTI
jgi:hypothetical protein